MNSCFSCLGSVTSVMGVRKVFSPKLKTNQNLQAESKWHRLWEINENQKDGQSYPARICLQQTRIIGVYKYNPWALVLNYPCNQFIRENLGS